MVGCNLQSDVEVAGRKQGSPSRPIGSQPVTDRAVLPRGWRFVTLATLRHSARATTLFAGSLTLTFPTTEPERALVLSSPPLARSLALLSSFPPPRAGGGGRPRELVFFAR